MAHGDIQGRARTSPTAPNAKGVCDDCDEWYQLGVLRKQMEFYGTDLKWTGYLVCRRCYCTPQPQLKPIILPPDPVPVLNPRPEAFQTDYGLQGAQQYTLFNPIYAQQSKAAVLAALASVSGVATPSPLDDDSGIILKRGVSQIMTGPAYMTRTYLAIYNPSNPQLQIGLGAPAQWGVESNLILGPGEALIWATSIGPVTQAAVNAIGLIPNVPFFAWEAPVFNPFQVIPFAGPGNLVIGGPASGIVGNAAALYSIGLTAPYALTVNLPAFDGLNEGPWTIKDALGIAGAGYPISIMPALGTNIDGLAVNTPFVLNFSYSAATFSWDPVLGKYIVS